VAEDFPAIEPTGRRYDFGSYAMSATSSLSGAGVRFNHSTAMVGAVLILSFADMRDSELETLREHYREHDGGYRSFLLPVATIWRGHTDPEWLAPATDRWIYDGELDEGPAKAGGFYDVTVQLRHVGPELA
jgi:hypothetical protein